MVRRAEQPRHVDVHRPLPLLDRHLFDRGRRSRDARVVHETVDAAEPRDGFRYRLPDRIFVRDVRPYGERPVADLVGRLVDAVASSGDGYGSALFGERDGDLAPDTSAAAGDKRRESV